MTSEVMAGAGDLAGEASSVYAPRRLMNLLIVRHAIAVPRESAAMPDDERPLTPRGKRRFRRAAAGLARLLDPPDALLTSPLLRAVETARIAAKAWGGIEPIEEPALAGSDVDAMLAAALVRVRESGDDDATLALIGHEPSVSALLARLIGGGRADRLEFRKGGAALVEVPGSAADGARLIWYLPPRVLRTLGDN
jgi:phosphohistidine phosphatase